MKRLLILTFVLCLAATGANAAAGGLRGGLTVDPDQVHVGAHLNLGPQVPPLLFVPNVEIGFGDNFTVVALNGDLIYDLPLSSFYIGGELGINFVSWDAPAGFSGDTSDTDLGLSALGGIRTKLASGTGMFFEIKLGLVDSPDFKFTVGFDVF